MFARINNLFKQWRSNRQQLRELLIKLEGLTDPTFLNRATSQFEAHPNCRSVIVMPNEVR